MNVLLITIDTLRHDFLGCYGNPNVKTPNIDRLAARGALFHQAFTNGTYTKTAFPPILSSTYAGMYGGPFFDVGGQRPMLAPILKSHGYSTAGFTANPLLSASLGYNSGFDVFEEPVPHVEARKWIRFKGMQRLLSQPPLNSALMRLGLETRPHPVYVDGSQITEKACAWLQDQTGKFFLWLHYMDAHWPYHDHKDLINGKARATAWRDRRVMWQHRRENPGPDMVNHIKKLYINAVQRLDFYIGQLIRCLKSQGVDKETLIIITSDHGEAFYEHGRWGHGAYHDFHEEIIRVPLLISSPYQNRYKEIHHIVSLIDLPPTILDILNLPINKEMEGESLVSQGNNFESVQVIIEMIDLTTHHIALRNSHIKYIYDESHPYQRELFDLENDPEEETNLLCNLSNLESRMEEKLNNYLTKVNRFSQRTSNGKWQTDPLIEDRLRALGYL